jgi:hypothetical protein
MGGALRGRGHGISDDEDLSPLGRCRPCPGYVRESLSLSVEGLHYAMSFSRGDYYWDRLEGGVRAESDGSASFSVKNY